MSGVTLLDDSVTANKHKAPSLGHVFTEALVIDSVLCLHIETLERFSIHSPAAAAVMEYACNLQLQYNIYRNDIINHYGEGLLCTHRCPVNSPSYCLQIQ